MYEKLALIYDALIREDVDYEAYAQWLDHLFQEQGRGNGSLLEVGCGTGTMTLLMEKKGYQLTGLDLSEEMLMEADRKAFEAGTSIRWFQGDVTQTTLPKDFDGVYSTMDTFNYILEEHDLLKSFQGIYEALKPGGLFVFDVNTPYRLIDIYGNNTFHFIRDDVCYIWECSYDEETLISRFDITFFVQDGDEDEYVRFDEVHLQKAYSVEEWISLLIKAGFVSVQTLDFLSEKQPLKSAQKVHLIARKPA